jgi:hypothetical protein
MEMEMDINIDIPAAIDSTYKATLEILHREDLHIWSRSLTRRDGLFLAKLFDDIQIISNTLYKIREQQIEEAQQLRGR